MARFIGRFLTEPKPEVVFTAPAAPRRGRHSSGGSVATACDSTAARNCSTMTPGTT